MAIVTAVNRPRGQTRGGMSAVLQYVMKEEKTAYQDRHLVTGVNCQSDSCCTEFISTKLQYGKDDGRIYYHFVQSFHPEEPVMPELAHRIALELAQQWKNYEVIVATHTDREHIHSHFIVNSVSFQTGRKLHFEKADLTQLRQVSDTLCIRHGLSVCQPKRQQAVSRPTQAEYRIAARGKSWKVRLAMQINEAMKYAVSRDQFLELMESEGYTVLWTANRKSITYTTPDGYRCRDYKLHDTKYLKGAMEDEFRIRETLFAHGRAAGHAAKCAPVEFEQGIQYTKAVTLTEANWMGLTQATELTGNSILKAQETLERLPTTQEMATLLAGQAGNLTAAHTEAVQQIQQTVQELLGTSRENLRWMQEAMQETRAASQRESEKLLKEFQSQAGQISETYSSRLSKAEDTLRESANSIRWKMYIPTIILVLWELVRHLWLRG